MVTTITIIDVYLQFMEYLLKFKAKNTKIDESGVVLQNWEKACDFALWIG